MKAMQVEQSPHIKKDINLGLNLSSEYSGIWDDELSKLIDEATDGWKSSVADYLEINNPFKPYQKELYRAQLDFKHNGASIETIQEDLDFYGKLDESIDTSFWISKLHQLDPNVTKNLNPNKTKDSISALRKNELEAWDRDLSKFLLKWQLGEIDRLREEFLKDIKTQLDALQDISESLSELGLSTGILWDTSIGSLHSQDIQMLIKWADFLKNDAGVQRLCEILGRMHREEQAFERREIQFTKIYKKPVIDINSREEIVGITIGRELENIIPQELSLLSDPDVALLFDLKYAENRLLRFEQTGITWADHENEETEIHDVAVHEGKGPIIICVDTSGSMNGPPETVAKAITMTLVFKAIKEKRDCYLINFSTGISTLDLTPPKGISDLITFLKMSFNGGTDVLPALTKALHIMETKSYELADVLLISDFIIPGFSQELLDAIQEQRDKGSRFFSLAIGAHTLKELHRDLFDQEWTYNAQTGSVSELYGITTAFGD